MKIEPLTASMDNVMASVLGKIAYDAVDKNVGDSIDRGLLLRRLLEEEGFQIIFKRGRKKWHRALDPHNYP